MCPRDHSPLGTVGWGWDAKGWRVVVRGRGGAHGIGVVSEGGWGMQRREEGERGEEEETMRKNVHKVRGRYRGEGEERERRRDGREVKGKLSERRRI
eukprot:297203-Hanusia_phi.AAC.2